MIYKILFFSCSIFLASCTDFQSEKETYLSGFFPNSKDSLIVLYHEDTPIDTARIDENKNFLFRFRLNEPKLYHIQINQKYQHIFLEPADSLVIFANMLNFEKSLTFSGKGSDVNNFLLSQYNNIEKEQHFFRNISHLQPSDYKKKMDSLLTERIGTYNAFLSEKPNLSEQAKEITLTTATFSIYKEMEAYPFVHKRNNQNSIINTLSDDFYSYRKDIKFNNQFLYYYRSYYNYMVMYINNLAFKLFDIKNPYGNLNKDELFHIKKLKVIDSVFSDRKMRDNLFRNAAYSYVFNIQDDTECNCYIEEFQKYSKNNLHSSEINQIFTSTIALSKGSIPPDIQLVDKEGRYSSLLKVAKSQLTVFYFWSSNQKDMSNLIFNRVLQLKELFPKIRFVGIEIGNDMTEWCELLPQQLISEQYHSVDTKDATKKYLINNISKCLILGEDNRIISAFETIFSPNLEKRMLVE